MTGAERDVERSLQFDRRTLTYFDSGADGRKVSGSAVVALHSLGTDRRIWFHQVGALTGAGHRVICPDARGHGASTWQPLSDEDDWADDLDALLDYAGVDEVTLVGVSMGCSEALDYAIRNRDRVVGMLVTGGFGDLPPEIGAAKTRYLVDGARAVGMAKWAEQYTIETLKTEDPDARARVRDAIAHVDLEAYTASAAHSFRPRHRPLSDIVVPTLVVWGELDFKTPRTMSADLVSMLGSATLVQLDGAGHLANVDQPAGFNRLLIDFLARSA